MQKFIKFLIAVSLLLPIATYAESNSKTLSLNHINFSKTFFGLTEENDKISIVYTTSISCEDDAKVLLLNEYLQVGYQKVRIKARGEYSEMFSGAKSKTISIPLLGVNPNIRGYYKGRARNKNTSVIMGSIVSNYKAVTTPLKYYSVTMPKLAI